MIKDSHMKPSHTLARRAAPQWLACTAMVAVWLAIPAAYAAPPEKPAARMVIIEGKDVSGFIYKRLGLPNREYCWSQCLQEERCSGTRWGAIEGDTAGQCVLISGPLTLSELPHLQTEDGKTIKVVASRKEAGGSREGT